MIMDTWLLWSTDKGHRYDMTQICGHDKSIKSRTHRQDTRIRMFILHMNHLVHREWDFTILLQISKQFDFTIYDTHIKFIVIDVCSVKKKEKQYKISNRRANIL